MTSWHDTFFDDEYLRLWAAVQDPEASGREADGLWKMLGLKRGARVLDAPCGAGRLAIPLAGRGAIVLGVDKAAKMIAAAEAKPDKPGLERLRFLAHDLRTPLPEGDFDVAINAYSSLGYGDESEDEAILRTLHDALRPGGRLVIETLHRDAFVAARSRGTNAALRLADGTLVVEEAVFDPLRGRVTTTFHWSGPASLGRKEASIRMYCITELAALAGRCGFHSPRLYAGCSPEPFSPDGPDAGGRVAMVLSRG